MLIFAAAALTLCALVWGDKFFALAGELIDSFTDTSRISDSWNLDIDTAAGEVKLGARSCDSDVWICAAADVCANVMGDGQYILVATTTLSGTKQWKTVNTSCDLPQCGQDGGQDGDVLDADNTINFVAYTARQACKEIGGRLPTVGELQCMHTFRTSFNDNFGSGGYWSGTEYSESNARYVNFSDGGVYGNGKAGAYSVRCVRGW